MNCYFSTACFQTADLAEIISLCREHRLNLELGSSLSYSPGLGEAMAGQNFDFQLLVHNYFPPPKDPFVLNLGSSDKEIHRRSFELCLNAIDLCVALSVPFYSVHAGFAFDMPASHLGYADKQRRHAGTAGDHREKGYDIFMDTMHRMANYAAARNIGLLVENNVATADLRDEKGRSPFYLTDVEEITHFFNEMNHPSMGLLMDTGHVKVSAAGLGIAPERYLEELAELIRCFHLSDNNGVSDQHQTFAPDAWFLPHLSKFPDSHMVIEIWQTSIKAMLAQKQVIEGWLAKESCAMEGKGQ